MTSKIAAALVKAQKEFGPALKTSTNPHFRSRYADLSACVEAVVDALNANGIALLQQTRDSDTGVTVETVFLHESGEQWASGPLHVPASKQDAQGYGSALTYARRYSLMAACGIAPEDDDGNAASKQKQKVQPIQPQHTFDIAKACDAIRTSPAEKLAVRYRDVALERCENDEQRQAVQSAFQEYAEAALSSA